LWFANTWSWGCRPAAEDACGIRPMLKADAAGVVAASHPTLGKYRLTAERAPDGSHPELLFTENDTNRERLWRAPNDSPYVKDSFHERVIHGRTQAVTPEQRGTKAAAWYRLEVSAAQSVTLRLRLRKAESSAQPTFGREFDLILAERQREADEFYLSRGHASLSSEERRIARQSAAGLL
ncbi:MAG TPA: hypothetical protein VHC70_14060, partial [Phycisphaerales bacterium]|nr:hypothetical protein [Phycisphaerales bacterium]